MDIQRGKLVGQNGPGSMYVDTDGSSYIISAADIWYDKRISNNDSINLEDFIVNDKRLSGKLGNKNFRLVPDFRTVINRNEKNDNVYLTIPVQRFPRVEYCQRCGIIKTAEKGKRKKWDYCSNCNKDRVFVQFPIVVVCEHGHIEDFPYFKYIHGDTSNIKNKENHVVKVVKSGSSILNWKLECSCERTHSLRGITGRGNPDNDDYITPFQNEMGKILELSEGKTIKCSGLKPWTGNYEDKEECVSQPRALLKNSLSIYRAETVKSLSITSEETDYSIDETLDDLYNEEYDKLSLQVNEDDEEKLKVTNSFTVSTKRSIIKQVNFIHRLQELVVQTDFHRVEPSDEHESFTRAKSGPKNSMLFSKDNEYKNWYPAKKMYGEGIFIEFDDEIMSSWENTIEIKNYFEKIKNRTESFYLSDRFSSASSIAIHTLSHLLMREFSRHCGYPITSLNERVYLGERKKGILIYVTDSDNAGTYGGLVRLAEEKVFKRIFDTALRNAEWCSSDPICREFGQTTGQGLELSNGSACHNCSFVPDISCNYRNCFLDREYIITNNSSNSHNDVSISNDYKWY